MPSGDCVPDGPADGHTLTHLWVRPDVTDDELAAYVGFLESPAGSHFHELGVAALDAALLDAACRLGELLPLGPEQSI